MDYPAIVEEGGSEYDLMCEGSFGPDRAAAEHRLKMRPNNLQHQDVVFSVWASYVEMIQESEDATRPGVRVRPGREMLITLDLIVPANRLSHDEFEGDVSGT